MGTLDDVEKNGAQEQPQQHLLEPGRANAISRQLHLHILPIFLCMSMLCYLDRTNSAFAALQMTHDLRFDAETYGLGSGLFFVGYSLSMIPSQYILTQVGAPRWLACIVTTWGLTAMTFAFMKNKTQFFVLRMLLGVSESGAFPGMWHYLNSVYPPDQVTLPYSLVEAAVGMANVVAAPLATSLLMLDGKSGMRGWQWLFLLEGLPSVATGLAMAYTLPKDHLRCSFLTNSDKAWLSQALSSHKKHAAEAEAQGFWKLLLDAARNKRLWLAGLAALLKNAAMVGILFWAPVIVHALLRGGQIDLGATGAGVGGGVAGHGHHHHHHRRVLFDEQQQQQLQPQYQWLGVPSPPLPLIAGFGGGPGLWSAAAAAAAVGAGGVGGVWDSSGWGLQLPLEHQQQDHQQQQYMRSLLAVPAGAAAAAQAVAGAVPANKTASAAIAAGMATTAAGAAATGVSQKTTAAVGAASGGAAAAAAAARGASPNSQRGVAAVLLTAVPFICAAVCAVWLGHRSQQKKEKCRHVAIPYAIAAALFVLFPSVASLGGIHAFLCLTLAIAALTAPNAILNSLASSVSAGPSSAIALALYNAVGNCGGLIGPYMIGRVVKATGLYASALQALGCMVGVAAALAWHMRRWNV